MKKFLVLIMMSFFGVLSANAQTEIPKANNVEVVMDNNNLVVSWVSDNSASINWKLEASVDNQNFKAIGWVLGAMPGESANKFVFKQAHNKLNNKFKYYRVVAVDEANGWAGAAVKLTK